MTIELLIFITNRKVLTYNIFNDNKAILPIVKLQFLENP